MKKITYVLLSIMVIISAMSLCACGGKDDSNETTKKQEETSTEATTAAKETEAETEDDGLVDYKVTVVDDAGNPVAKAMVQCCKDSCVPAMTNENGVAEFKLAEDDYDVKFAAFPEGYEYMSDEEVFHFEDGKYELTITIKKK
ncbi:MAG: hypothetical protein IJD58_06540 [Lachnospiraceae bacterium]|nr:hypothetical protein [Lachnospiraceae bacterium]